MDAHFRHPETPLALSSQLMDGAPTVVMEPGWTLAHVMHAAGLFPSVSQAKGNGWNRPVPDGWSEFVVGKMRKRVYISGRDPACQMICEGCAGSCLYAPGGV